jgi:phage terminase large subunit-like protein
MESPASRLATWLATLTPAERKAYYDSLSPDDAALMIHNWSLLARPDQVPPEGNDWRVFLMLAGRGAGKTRAAAEWVRNEIESGRRRRIGIVGPTIQAVKSIMVEGPSGLLSIAPPWCVPVYEASNDRLIYPNGAIVLMLSGDQPDRVRGHGLDGGWIDELCACHNPAEVWTQLQLALREIGPKGARAQCVITTTPRPTPVLRAIMNAPTTRLSRVSTYANAPNLDPATLQYFIDTFEGSSIGRQELHAQVLNQAEGALWTRKMIDDARVGRAPANLKRIVVAVDPSVTGDGSGAECGIVACGLGYDDHAYVLADRSGRMSPDQWARAAVNLYRELRADRIVAEANQGWFLVKRLIESVDRGISVKLVNARRGKQARAEPVVGRYEQGKVHHVGVLDRLEDQMTSWEPLTGDASPDRVDALCWAIFELLMKHRLEDRPRPTAPNVIALYAR